MCNGDECSATLVLPLQLANRAGEIIAEAEAKGVRIDDALDGREQLGGFFGPVLGENG